MKTENKKYTGILCLLLIFGIGLRLLLLGEQSLWFDEAFTYSLVSKNLTTAAIAEVNNPPVYTVLLYFWAKVFGYTEAGLRSFSAFCSCVTLLLLIPIGRLYLQERAVQFLILIVAISPFHIYYAQEARCFALLNCWLFALLLSLESYIKSPSWKSSLLLILFAELALYTHFISVFFIATGFFYAAWKLKNNLRSLAWLTGVHGFIVLLFSPWLITMLQAAGGGGQLRKYLLLKLPQTYISFLFGDTLFPLSQDMMGNVSSFLSVYIVPLGLAALVSALLGILVFIDLIALRRTSEQSCIVSFAVVPVLLVFCISFKLMMLDERYVQFSSFFVYALIARSLAIRWQRPSVKALFLIFLLLQSWSDWNYFTNASFGKEQWREVVRYVESQVEPDEVVLFDVGYLDIAYQYYQSESVEKLRAVQNYSEPVEVPFEWEPRIASVDHLVLIRSHFENDLVLSTLKEHFAIEEQKYFKNGRGISVYILKRRNV